MNNSEELLHDGSSVLIWVELTYPCNKHGPSDTTEESHNVRVDRPSYVESKINI